MSRSSIIGWCVAILCSPLGDASAQDEPNVPFIDQTLQRSDDFYSTGMKSLVEEVVKVSGISDETKISELRKAAQAAVADKMSKSKIGLWKIWKSMAFQN